MFTEKEIKDMFEVDIITARGRNGRLKRAINLEPSRDEVVRQASDRADYYRATAMDIKYYVETHRAGISEQELENIEQIRERLFVLASDVFDETMIG